MGLVKTMDHAFKQTVKYLLRIHQASEALNDAFETQNSKKIDSAMNQVFGMIKFFEMHDGWRDPSEDETTTPEYQIFLECEDMVIKIEGTLGSDMYPDTATLKYRDERGVEIEYVPEPDDLDALENFAGSVYFGRDES